MRPRTAWVLAGAVLLAALALRLGAPRDLALWIDEDLTWLSVRAILDGGLPVHPSGLVYLRAPLHTYLAALSSWALGLDEPALRLPSLLFSLATVVASFLLGRRVGGPGTGLLAALALALSPWDIFYAGMARMYAPLLFSVTLGLFFVARAAEDGDRASLLAAAGCGILAVALHPLGIVVGVALLSTLFLAEGRRPAPLVAVLGSAAIAFAGAASIVLSSMGRSGAPSSIPPSMALHRSSALDTNTLVLDARSGLADLARWSVPAGLLVAAAVLALAWLAWRRAAPPRGWPRLAAAGLVACVLLGWPWPVLVCLVLLVPALPGRRVLPWAAFAGAGLALSAAAHLLGPAGRQVGATVRAFTAFPTFWPKLLLRDDPGLCALAALGALALLARRRPAGYVLVAAVAGGFLVQGLIRFPYFLPRYNVYLNPALLVLAASAVLAAAGETARRLGRAGPVGGACVAVVLLLATPQARPWESWRMREFGYGSNRGLVRNADVTSAFCYDVRSPAAYVASRRRPGDLVVVRDGPAVWPYLRPVDFVFRKVPYDGAARTPDGRVVDRNVGVPVLSTPEALRQVLETRGGRTAWIVVSDGGPKGPQVNLPEGGRELLQTLGAPAYTGADGITRVWRVPPAE